MAERDVFVVLCTVPQAEAEALTEQLVAERLVACINVVGPVQSVYRWQGKVERDQEMLLVMKTSAAGRQRLRDRIAELHSYSTPEVLELAVDDGLPAYLAWVVESCDQNPDSVVESDQGDDANGR